MKVSTFHKSQKIKYISCIVLSFSLMVTMLLPLSGKDEGTAESGASADSNFGVANTPWSLAEKDV